MTTRADELREAMTAAAHKPYPPTIFRDPPKEALSAAHEALKRHGSTLDGLSAFTIRGCIGPWTMENVARALVETLGLSWDTVRAIRVTPISGMVSTEEYGELRPHLNAAADALATLLEASGLHRDREEGE